MMEEESAKEIDEETSGELSRKSERNTVIALGVIILLTVLFVVAKYAYKPEQVTIDGLLKQALDGKLDEDEGFVYHGFPFVFDAAMNSWVTQVQLGDTLVQIPLHYSPRDVGNVSVVGLTGKSFEQRRVFITFDPNSTQMQYIALSAAELGLNLAKGVNAEPIAACTTNETACYGRPIVTCNNTNYPVIYLKIADSTRIIQKDNCVTIQGDGWDLVRAVDRFILKWYQVMP
jgi:hypothetical protein